MPQRVMLAPPENVMVQCENLVKIYKTTEVEVMALQGLDLTVERGELMGIVGASGSGKSTLLNMLGALDKPSAGSLFVDGKDLLKFDEKDLIKYKRETVGFVWQNNARNLLPYLTALENVQTPMLFERGGRRRQRAGELLELVGMAHRKNSRLDQLSGGEQQRVAIALALANKPKLLLADEPTGAVDAKTAAYILDVFRRLNEELGLTIVIVTHDPNLARKVNRVVAIRDGKTSAERIAKGDYAARLDEISGFVQETHDEYALLDRAGRLQLPREMLDALQLSGNRVRVEMENGRIVLTAPDEPGHENK